VSLGKGFDQESVAEKMEKRDVVTAMSIKTKWKGVSDWEREAASLKKKMANSKRRKQNTSS